MRFLISNYIQPRFSIRNSIKEKWKINQSTFFLIYSKVKPNIMLTYQDLDLIRQYVMGNLTNDEVKIVKQRIAEEKEFRQEVVVQQEILDLAIAMSKKEMLGKIMDKIEREKKGEKVYSTTELLNAFAPNKDMERILNAQRGARGAQHPDSKKIKLLKPIVDNLEVSGSVIDIEFELETALDVPLLLTVVDNDQNIIKEGVVEAKTKQWIITFGKDTPPLSPGYYYWEVEADIPDPEARDLYGKENGKFAKDYQLLPDRYKQ